MRNRLQVALQIMLALIACLLGIATNYATITDEVPWVLEAIQRFSVPAIGLLIVTLVVGQVVVYRLENPAPPRVAWPRERVWTRSTRTRRPSTSAGRHRPPN